MATMTNVKAQYTEDAVGQNHPTLADTINRCAVGMNNFRLVKSGANLTLEMVGGDLVDINGDIMRLVGTMPTLTPPSTAIQIEGITRANPAVVTWTGNGLEHGRRLKFAGITQASWNALNAGVYMVGTPGANSFTLVDLANAAANTSAYGADYVPGTDPGTIQCDTLYYVYLYNSSGTATLEASTTVPVADTKGRWTKTNDTARRLMGMALRLYDGTWISDGTCVRSFNHRMATFTSAQLASPRPQAAASWTEPTGAAEARVRFLAWGDEVWTIALSGTHTQVDNTGTVTGWISIGVDSTSAPNEFTAETMTYNVVKHAHVVTQQFPAMGLHYAAMVTMISPGATANCSLGASTSLRAGVAGR